jgi:mycothiol synthase
LAILYRSLQPGDEISVVECWNQLFPKDKIDLEFFFEVVLCNFHFVPEQFILAFDQAEIVGMIHGTSDRESSIGYVHFFGVSEAHRRRGIGTRLLKTIEERFARDSCSKMRIADYPYSYILPGIDVEEYHTGIAFLLDHGFRTVHAPVSMELNMDPYRYPDSVYAKRIKLNQAGYDVVACTDEHLPHLLALCKNHLQRDWQFTIQRAYLQKRLPGRGFLCFHNAGTDARILVGFSFFGIVTDNIGRFGPIGVNPEYRGMAIGEVLMHQCLQAQKELGAPASYFLWSYEDSPAGRMYKKTGFTVTRRMSVMSKDN